MPYDEEQIRSVIQTEYSDDDRMAVALIGILDLCRAEEAIAAPGMISVGEIRGIVAEAFNNSR